MKNKLFLTFISLVLVGVYIDQVFAEIPTSIPESTLKGVLELTNADATTGCILLSSPGDLLAALTPAEKARACVVCGDDWAKDEKNNSKALVQVCGKSGSPTDKQKEILTKSLGDCEQLALMHRHFDLLTKDQRLKAISDCFSKWEQHPKARKAIMNPEDVDLSKEVKGKLPSWNEVAQLQIFAKADPKGQMTQEITQEQFNTVLKK